MEDDFTHLLRVRYSECDAQKVVFNAKFVEYIDVAVTEFMRYVWGGYNTLLESGLDNQVVGLNINWKSPARFDYILAIRIRNASIGTTSFKLQVDFSLHSSAAAIATAEITYVLVSAATYQKAPIPEALKVALMQGAKGMISNHAG